MWRSRIFWRLFGVYSVLLTLSFGVLGWLLIHRMETHLLQELQRGLEAKASLIRELVNRQDASELQAQVMRIAGDMGARITLIQADGKVLADSDEQPGKMENHGDRPEVRQAESSGVGVSTRYSGTVHQSMMYVARRNDQGAVRFVRIALPLDAVTAEARWPPRAGGTGSGVTL